MLYLHYTLIHSAVIHFPCDAGRAGNKGTAITFIAPEDDQYAPDLVKALKESKAPIPKDLQALADAFLEKCKAGTAQAHGTGFGGTGFKFDTTEEEERRAARKVCAIPAIALLASEAFWHRCCFGLFCWLDASRIMHAPFWLSVICLDDHILLKQLIT